MVPSGAVKSNSSAEGVSSERSEKPISKAGLDSPRASTSTCSGIPVSESTAIETEPTRVASVRGVSTRS